MPNLRNNELFAKDIKLSDLVNHNIENIKEFVNTANSRLDAIISITNNSHAIAADAVTAMICENEDSLSSNNSVNTTNKMSVCLRDGEIILRYVTYLLITNDESILEKSCLKDLKDTYLSLGVPLPNAIRVVELIRNATISDIKTTMNLTSENQSIIKNLISETELYFKKIINLFK
tara:strand:+ start:2194 stop:2721 length:528 start_codon:yes stop_codon:yes gene_type:complete